MKVTPPIEQDLLSNIVGPKSGVTMLNNNVEKIEQCWQQNIVQYCFYQYFIKSLIIHEENTKKITTVAEVLNRQEICFDSHKL